MEYPDLSAAKLICIDLETYDPNLKEKGPGTFRNDSWIAGISIKPSDGKSIYYPIGHTEGNLPIKAVKQYCKDQLGTDIPKLGAKILYDLEWLNWLGVKVGGKKYDIQVAEPLLDENRFQYNLEDIAQRRLGVGKYKDQLLFEAQKINPKIKKTADIFKVLYKMPPDKVAIYACQDTDLLVPIFQQQQQEMSDQDLNRVFGVETELIDLLLQMRINGVRVNIDEAEQIRERLVANEKELHNRVNKIAGQTIDMWAAENIAIAFDRAGLPYPKTAKTKKPSFTAPWLEAHPSELAQLIVQLRKMNKLRTDFVENMVIGSAINGRIHPSFNPVKHDEGGTVSGRFSSSNPNLQQVPSRDPVNGPLIRGLFIPEDGCLWSKGDYKQQEPRVTVHYAYLKKFLGADIARQKYIDDPNTDYHQMVADMCEIERRPAKDINLGLAYGMGVDKMAEKLGKTKEETRLLYAKYHKGVPFVKLLAENCMQVATTRGYIKTLLGRRRRFNLFGPPKFDKDNPITPLPYDEAVKEFGLPLRRAFTHKALNALIQGTSADMVKIAMVNLYHAGYIPHLTVHDETDTSVETVKQHNEIRDIMANAVKLEVPLVVDMFLEKNWGLCK
jgi:DNA polymerase I-like protein with 3'-5' exonuclease and polymerase domains